MNDIPMKPHKLCASFGCLGCQWTGEIPMTDREIESERAEMRSDADRDMRAEREL